MRLFSVAVVLVLATATVAEAHASSVSYAEAHDAANVAKYERLARAECEPIVRQYPKSEQADAARQLLRSLK